MMKPLTYIVVFLLIACNQGQRYEKAQKTEHTDIKVIAENYYEERLQLFPLEATAIADNRYNHLLQNDISEPFRAKLRQFYSNYLNLLAKTDTSGLTEQDQLTYAVLKRELKIGLDGLAFNEHYLPVQQFESLTLTLPQLGSGQHIQPFKTVKDYDDFLKRISDFAIWTDTAISNMRKGLASGETYPRALMEKVLPQLDAMLVNDPKKSIFYQPITNLPASFKTEEKSRLTAAYITAIHEQVIPSYKKLHAFIQTEYIPKTRTSSGFSDVPNGKAYYDFLIQYWTTTSLSADAIYEMGLKEVERIRTEMEKIKDEVGFKGTLKAFFDHINADKKFMPFSTDEEVIQAYRDIEGKMKPQLSKLFTINPKTKFEIRQTEEFREASSSAEYQQGAPDGSRPGIFYAPVLDAKKYNYTAMETLFLHEAIPGHHYQVSLQQENENLPKFRRFGWYGAYGEGWALYSESLGRELGLFRDPYQYFGHLGDEMHRAIRLVVDVGIHVKGWSREKAIEYMMNNEPITEEGAVAEIERYMAIPGQALSYKIGQLKISELRRKAETDLGEAFNIAAFHTEVLKDGCLPLDVFEKKMNAWITKQKKEVKL